MIEKRCNQQMRESPFIHSAVKIWQPNAEFGTLVDQI